MTVLVHGRLGWDELVSDTALPRLATQLHLEREEERTPRGKLISAGNPRWVRVTLSPVGPIDTPDPERLRECAQALLEAADWLES